MLETTTGDIIGCEHGVLFEAGRKGHTVECYECNMEMETTDAAARLERENAHAKNETVSLRSGIAGRDTDH